MPFTAKKDEDIVEVGKYQAEWDGQLLCPECGDKMHYRQLTPKPYRVAHFAHNPRPSTNGERACSFALETDAHRMAKLTLYDEGGIVFGCKDGKFEHSFTVNGRKRRADVWFPAQGELYPLAFEAQYSKCGFDDIKPRTADYHAAGYHIVWCFPRHRKELIEACMREYGCVGILNKDGDEVQFHGVKNLALEEHPQEWYTRRVKRREEREARERAQREEQARRAAEAERKRAEREAREREQYLVNLVHERQETDKLIEEYNRLSREPPLMLEQWRAVRRKEETERVMRDMWMSDDVPRPPCPGEPGEGWVWAILGNGQRGWVKLK